MDKYCKLCKEPLPPFALHFSNTVAIEEGYCSYFCLVSALGDEKALKVVQKYPEKMRTRKQKGQSPQGEYLDIGRKYPNRENSPDSGKKQASQIDSKGLSQEEEG
jgi:hypothetical protein